MKRKQEQKSNKFLSTINQLNSELVTLIKRVKKLSQNPNFSQQELIANLLAYKNRYNSPTNLYKGRKLERSQKRTSLRA